MERHRHTETSQAFGSGNREREAQQGYLRGLSWLYVHSVINLARGSRPRVPCEQRRRQNETTRPQSSDTRVISDHYFTH